MAHVENYTRKDMKKIMREAYREMQDEDSYKNEVDGTRTHLNYTFRHKTAGEAMTALDVRVADIMQGRTVQKQTNVVSSWAVTCPQEILGDSEKERRFFELVYKKTQERYGEKNVIDGVVHYDETTPHMTLYIVPEAVSRKTGQRTVSSASLMTKKELREYQVMLDKACEAEFGMKNLILNGRTKGGYTLEEMKARTQEAQEMARREEGLSRKEGEIARKEAEIERRYTELKAKEASVSAREAAVKQKEAEGTQKYDDAVKTLSEASEAYHDAVKRLNKQAQEEESARLLAQKEATARKEAQRIRQGGTARHPDILVEDYTPTPMDELRSVSRRQADAPSVPASALDSLGKYDRREIENLTMYRNDPAVYVNRYRKLTDKYGKSVVDACIEEYERKEAERAKKQYEIS